MPFSRWLFLTVPGFVISVVLLILTIRSLLRTLAGAAVVSLPVLPEQIFTVKEPGTYELYAEGRLGTRDFGGVDFSLADESGKPVRMDPILFRTAVTSFSRARLSLKSFEAGSAGTYTLRAKGLGSNASPDNRLLINRPVRGAMVLHILGLVLFGCLTIGSLVASALVIVLPGRAAQP